MPAKSRDQQQYLLQRFGPAWLHRHHFDNALGKSSHQAGHPLAGIHRKRKKKT